ncbi:MAG: lytic murein transglycosylase [Pseudomonadota bacterium]|jgi:membrane-bound lytic murein transglycosylase B|nr:lytic murein transglycosylase [Pseudomonadota bacterium]
MFISRYLITLTIISFFIQGFGAKAIAEEFNTWLDTLKIEARSKGISQSTIESSLSGIKPIPRVIELDRKQPEFTLTFKEYLRRVVSDRRIRIGKAKLVEHEKLLAEISIKYGVQPRYIIALWGIETDFGRITGGFPVISSLATLAYDGRRSKFFRKELFLALKIVDKGHITAKDMLGSWAGAMGQNQFMPSSFHAYAVDYNRDGSKDIWKTLPDIFASIANYLSKSGWQGDQTWGRAVRLPDKFSSKLLGRKIKKGLNQWHELGVRKLSGKDLPKRNLISSIIRPEKGMVGPAFVVYHNYGVILKWNRSNYFATAVGTLSDKIKH